jgi:transposase InsO family protein
VFVGDPRAAVAARFLRFIARDLRRLGWPLQRVLTDGGSEFKGDFDRACKRLDVRHTRTKPRHAFTNGFVERLQGTFLHEHWRVEFRRRSPACTRSSGPCRASCGSTITTGPTADIGPKDGHRPRSSKEPSMTAELSTPFRHWTA